MNLTGFGWRLSNGVSRLKALACYTFNGYEDALMHVRLKINGTVMQWCSCM